MPYNSKRWDKVYIDFKANRKSVWKLNATKYFADKTEFLKENGVSTILDAGCGDGRNLLFFEKSNFKVTGVDGSKEALIKAESNTNNAELIKADLNNYCDENKFDAILCDYVLCHTENTENVLNNLKASTKNNGFLLLEFLSKNDPSATNADLETGKYEKNGISTKFFSKNEVEELLNDLSILDMQEIEHSDPDHVEDFPRPKEHNHVSIYVLAQKS